MNKKSQRSELGRAIFLSRDSGGKHEMTFGKYVEWAQRTCKSLDVKFTGTPKAIKRIVEDCVPASGDLFFDYCVSGDLLSRPALDACREEIRRDLSISHLLIPRRDRLARPGDAMDGVRLEKAFRMSSRSFPPKTPISSKKFSINVPALNAVGLVPAIPLGIHWADVSTT